MATIDLSWYDSIKRREARQLTDEVESIRYNLAFLGNMEKIIDKGIELNIIFTAIGKSQKVKSEWEALLAMIKLMKNDY